VAFDHGQPLASLAHAEVLLCACICTNLACRSCGICKGVLRELENVCRESRQQRARIVFLRHDLQVGWVRRAWNRSRHSVAVGGADRPNACMCRQAGMLPGRLAGRHSCWQGGKRAGREGSRMCAAAGMTLVGSTLARPKARMVFAVARPKARMVFAGECQPAVPLRGSAAGLLGLLELRPLDGQRNGLAYLCFPLSASHLCAFPCFPNPPYWQQDAFDWPSDISRLYRLKSAPRFLFFIDVSPLGTGRVQAGGCRVDSGGLAVEARASEEADRMCSKGGVCTGVKPGSSRGSDAGVPGAAAFRPVVPSPVPWSGPYC